MSKRTLAGDRRRRKMITTLWIFIVSALVIILIYKELTALLYILATLGVCVLLLLVAFADLSHIGDSAAQSDKSNDAAGVADKLS